MRNQRKSRTPVISIVRGSSTSKMSGSSTGRCPRAASALARSQRSIPIEFGAPVAHRDQLVNSHRPHRFFAERAVRQPVADVAMRDAVAVERCSHETFSYAGSIQRSISQPEIPERARARHLPRLRRSMALEHVLDDRRGFAVFEQPNRKRFACWCGAADGRTSRVSSATADGTRRRVVPEPR